MAKRNAYYVGRRVRLVRDIVTRGGDVFPEGSICKVVNVYRGRLSLTMPNPNPDNIFGDKILFVRQVRTWDVELLPKKH